MTPYHDAWIDLIRQRDTFYLEILAAAVTVYAWYRLWLRRFFRWCLGLALLIIIAGLLWGLYYQGGLPWD
jgi:hypothetical protein